MLKILIIILFFAAVFLLRRILAPVFIGIFIAYILDPYVQWLSRKLHGRRLLCIFIAYLTVTAAIFGLIWGFADIIVGKMENGSLQEAIQTLMRYYDRYKDTFLQISGFAPKQFSTVSVIRKFTGGTADFLIGAIISIYLLKDKEFFLRLGSQMMHLLLKQKTHGLIREILFEINDVISAFLRGVCIDSVIVAFLSSLALTVLNIDCAVLIGCFAGIANVIPYFGPFIGIIPAVLSALTEGGLTLAIAAALTLFAVQQIECNLIYPRIIGKSTGLHPLFVLISVSAAGALGGLLWMILAVPAAGIIRVLICKWAQYQ